MEKTPVDTRTLEEQLLSSLNTAISEESQTCRPLDCNDIERIVGRAEKLLADFRERFEEECFQAWDIAQAFKIDVDKSRFLDEQRVFRAQQEGFRATVGAYNREREKEQKTEHKFPLSDVPEEHPDNCIHHDDE